MTTGLMVGIGIAIVWYFLKTYVDFAPFQVRVTLTRSCLLEYGLATGEQLDALTGVSDTSPLARGIGFSLLRVGMISDQGTLVYWNDWHGFSTKFDALVDIPELRSEAPDLVRSVGLKSVCPQMSMGRSLGGLEIGVAMWTDRRNEKVVATLPWAAFGTIPQWRTGRMSAKTLTKQLRTDGWAVEPREPGDPQPHALTHKYARVEWDYI